MKALEGEPLRKNFSRAFEYSDCWVDDARLVVLNALDVDKRGGAVLTRTPLTSARRVADTWRVDLRSARDRNTLQATGKISRQCCGPLGRGRSASGGPQRRESRPARQGQPYCHA